MHICVYNYMYINLYISVWLSTHRACAVFITHFFTLAYTVIQCHSIALELQLIVLPIILSILFYHLLSNSNLKSDGDFSS